MGIGDWGLGPIPNPQSPIPNPQSPINELKSSQKEITGIYNRVLDNYHKMILSLIPIDILKKKKKCHDILRKLFEIFELVVNGILSIDSLYMLDNITLVNFENDNNLISEIKSNSPVKDDSIVIY